MMGLSSDVATRGGVTAYAIRVAIANAFLVFPLIVLTAEAMWGQAYGTLPFKYFVYLATFLVIPIIGAGGFRLRQLCERHGGVTSLLYLALTCPGTIAAALYPAPNGSWRPEHGIEVIAALMTLLAIAGGASSFFIPRPWRRSWEHACRPLTAAIWTISVPVYAIVALWGEVGWVASQLASNRAFQLGVTAGAACVATYYAGPRLLRSKAAGARAAGRLLLAVGASVATIAVLAAVFHPASPCDGGQVARTYGEEAGPAAAVLAGGVPMVDAFSQYGLLIYLVYAAAFKFLVPPSLFGATAVTQALNLLLVPAIAVAICLKKARNRFLVVLLIGAITPALPLIWSASPALSGVRFAPPMLLLLALSWLRPGRTHSPATVAAMALCSLWSLEVLVWTVVAYVAFLVAVYLAERDGLSRYLRSLALTLSCMAGAHFLFSLSVLAASGSWPRYDIYLSLFTVNISEAGFAVLDAELGNPIWLLPFGICIVGLAYTLSIIFWGRQVESSWRWTVLSVVFPGVVLSVMALSYWVSRSFEALIWTCPVPILVSLTLMCDRLLMQGAKRPVKPRLVDLPVHATLAGAVMLLTAYLGSFAASYGASYAPEVAQTYYKGIFSGQPVASCIGQRAFDAITLVKKYEPNRRDALFFMPGGDDVIVALYSGHRERLGYSAWHAEHFSTVLAREADRRLHELVKPGDVMVTMAYTELPEPGSIDLIKPFDNYLYSATFGTRLGNLYQACEIEQTPRGVVAVRLIAKGQNACKGIGKPFAYEIRHVLY